MGGTQRAPYQPSKKHLNIPKQTISRAEFEARITAYEQQGRSVVYLDESGFAEDMPGTHGDSKRRQRCFGTHDGHAKGRINAMGAIMDFAFLIVYLFNGSVNSDGFYAWLT